MVKVKEDAHFLNEGSIDAHAWLQHLILQQRYSNIELLRSACALSQIAGFDHATPSGESCTQQGLHIAEILADLEADADTLAAAIIYPSVEYADLALEDVEEQLNPRIAKLIAGVKRMNALHDLRNSYANANQVDKIRKMLLTMVDDARVVLIKLAERLQALRTIAPLSDTFKQHVAKEAMAIYAPLAHRLGIGQLKWELEDLAFRYINADKYKEIAKGLQSRRLEREQYVENIVAIIKEKLLEAQVTDFKVYGRAKHIHSIYRKMQRKNLNLGQIYDAIAVRVLVPTLDECYTTLSIIHHLWKAIPEEFDDYIHHAKPNGYRSLHTAVIGPEQRTFEVQIRTTQMHEQAELGVAAHWKYKEGAGPGTIDHEKKIAWLREVLEWQKELATQEEKLSPVEQEHFEDRVYVFTPKNEIIDLPSGATPLDFAYHIHSEVGHRCRGAKINGHMVTINHVLKTGDQIEILTTNTPKPSRDWLNPQLGYITSPRARAKVHHWFKQQDYEKHAIGGREILERELHKLNMDFNLAQLEKIIDKFNFKSNEDLMAALGRNDIKFGQVLHYLQQLQPINLEGIHLEPITTKRYAQSATTVNVAKDIDILGVGNLLTNIAKCCHPVPGDSIIGYITLGRGVSIHRADCPNILQINTEQSARLLEVDWGKRSSYAYPVTIQINAFDRSGLLRDITQICATLRVNVAGLNSRIQKEENTAFIELVAEISDLQHLSQLLTQLEHIRNVLSVKRLSNK